MTDREKAGLRGPVQKVVAETLASAADPAIVWSRGDYITRYTYDPQGRLNRVANTKGNAAEFTAEMYQYAPDGGKTKILFIPPDGHGPNVGFDLSIEGSELSIPSQGAASLTTVTTGAASPQSRWHMDRGMN